MEQGSTAMEPAGPPAASGGGASASGPKSLRLDDIERKPLTGAGNYLWKIPYQGGHDGFAVLKVYFGSRHPALHWKKTFGNRLLTGRSSHMPRARLRTEMECIGVWEKHGFRCFGTFPDVKVEGLPENGYMLYDWTPGVHFREYFKDEQIPLDERMATWRDWVPEWCRRHRVAVREREPRLIHENGDVKHVMLWQGGYVYFDFEVQFTSTDIHDLVGREILAYMRSVGKFFHEEMYDRMLDELVEHYPDKALLRCAWEHAFRNRNPIMRVARAMDRSLKPQHRARFSKYMVARDIAQRLDAASLTSQG